MKGMKRTTPSSYEVGDFVSIVDDSHEFGGSDFNGREEEILPGLTDVGRNKLIMSDERPSNFAAISQLPTFRGLYSKSVAMKQLHRRKYQFINGVVALKDNAQEQD